MPFCVLKIARSFPQSRMGCQWPFVLAIGGSKRKIEPCKDGGPFGAKPDIDSGSDVGSGNASEADSRVHLPPVKRIGSKCIKHRTNIYEGCDLQFGHGSGDFFLEDLNAFLNIDERGMFADEAVDTKSSERCFSPETALFEEGNPISKHGLNPGMSDEYESL